VGLEFYCLFFFRTPWGVGVLNSAVFNSFHNRVEFGMILEGLRNFGGGLNTPTPPSVRHCHSLPEHFYNPWDLESRESKLQVPALKEPSWNGKKLVPCGSVIDRFHCTKLTTESQMKSLKVR